MKTKAISDSSFKGSEKGREKYKSGKGKRGKGFSNYDKNYVAVNGRVVRKFCDYYKDDYKNFQKKGDFYVDGINSQFLCKHPYRISTRSQKYRKVPDPMFELYHLNEDLFKSVDINIDDYIVMTGSYDSNKHILQRTMIPDIEDVSVDKVNDDLLSSYDDIVKAVLRKVVLFTLPDPTYVDFCSTYFNKDTLPGFHYSEIFGMKTKEQASDTAFTVAKSKWNYIESCCRRDVELCREKLFPSTFTIGARNKRDIFETEGDVITSRAIHMPDFHDEICNSPWLNPITEHIVDSGKGPIYIGNSYVKYERLVKDTEDNMSILEGDWKRFDSTLYLHMILIGISILRCFYPLDSKRSDYHFTSIFDSLSIKDYYTPGGNIYRLYHGIPSGVKCTNLLGSIINLIALIKCCSRSNPKNMNFCVGGDDHLVIFKKEVITDEYLEIIKNNANKIGMSFKFLKKKDFLQPKSDDRPIFYKYTLDKGEPIIPASSMIERIFCPWNNNYSNNTQCYEFIRDVVPSLGSPRTTHLLFYALYVSLYKRVFQEDITLGDVYKIHLSSYKRVMREKRDPKLMFSKRSTGIFTCNVSKQGFILRDSYMRGVSK